MKLSTILALASVASAANTGVDCSKNANVCDRNSECCGTAIPFTVTENTAQTKVDATADKLTVCYRKDKKEI